MMDGGIGEIVRLATTWIIPVLLAVTLHEAAHGFAAMKLGDDTAKQAGRLSLNPFRHVDPLGTIILPALLLITRAPILFGWAKPVPVRFGRLRNPRRGMVLVALAGPGTNLVLAVVSAALLHVSFVAPDSAREWLQANLVNSVQLNLILAVFNMLPIPPLDGGRVAVGLLPPRLAAPYARLEGAGMFIVLGMLFILPMMGLNLFIWLVAIPVQVLGGLVFTMVGLG